MASGSIGVASQPDAGGDGASGLAVTVAHEPQAEQSPAAQPRVLPEPGQRFGDYQIVRTLGRGGMGAVYEAEQLDTGRRVALKVLKHSLDSPEARKRFLREGRLAASINHPNSVYVYGTEEIAGTPAISMELVAGGTLQERVKRDGPMPIGEAVDAVLQIIAGLEAAQKLGVLHRDIKPANCFFDTDGSVKVGDFGLSISTAARGESDVTHSNSFLGTPAFASPEQLRGDELNVRSDMYSVGVTLYYLLTGRTPFEADNMVKLLATVLERTPESPKKFRPDIPQGLAAVVLRCLEKQPTERYADYGELRQALVPFSSTTPRPAALGLRFAAGVIDRLFLSAIAWIIYVLVWRGSLDAIGRASSGASADAVLMMGLGIGLWLVYFGLLEGRWGASLGKWICGLRVVDESRQPPGAINCMARTAIFVSLSTILWATRFVVSPTLYAQYSFWIANASLLSELALFLTARRHNGFAAVQDLLTHTRVIHQPAYQVRPTTPTFDEDLPAAQATTIGPYHVLDVLSGGEGQEVVLGYDTRLLRRVWIRKLPAGTPPIAAAVRNVARAGRLRWLNGRRSTSENWDVYEAPSGQPLLSLISQRQPWSAVRFWLLDVAQELDAANADGTSPADLTLDRVWITADGRAKLLDFSAPGTPSQTTSSATAPTSRQFLIQLSVAALEGRTIDATAATTHTAAAPLPIPARECLLSLANTDQSPAALLEPLVEQPVAISRRRRLGLVVACVLPSIILGGFGFVSGLILRRAMGDVPDEFVEITTNLMQLADLEAGVRPVGMAIQPDDARAMEIYISDRYGKLLLDPKATSNPYIEGMLKGPQRKELDRIRTAHPNPSEKEVLAAVERLQPVFDDPSWKDLPTSDSILPYVGPIVFAGCLIWTALLSLVLAVTCRLGPVLRILGIELVTANGEPASRGRLLWRGLLAWSPVWLPPVLMALLVPLVALATAPEHAPTDRPTLTEEQQIDADVARIDSQAPVVAVPIGVTLVLVFLSLTVWSLALPGRGLPDRLARTWPVPR